MNELFILDFGSGNTCKNDMGIIDDMIEQLALVDEKRRCVIKWQLFKSAGDNVPLSHACFEHASIKATEYGFRTTASVFDEASLQFLLKFDIPFVKIANNPDLYPLANLVPRGIPLIISYKGWNNVPAAPTAGDPTNITDELIHWMCCVSDYPASVFSYLDRFDRHALSNAISDHTTTWDLYRKFKPEIYECHYKLPDSTGLDAGPFARTPEMIREILQET